MSKLSNLSLPGDLHAFVQAQVDCGAYATHNEVVREALTLLRERNQLREIRLQRLRGDVQIGLDQIENGDVAPLRIDEIKDRVRAELAKSRTL